MSSRIIFLLDFSASADGNMAMELLCPHCREPLEDRRTAKSGAADGGAWFCATCGARYPVRYGVACFLDEKDPFYEGRFPGSHHVPVPQTLPGRLFFRVRLAWAFDLSYVNLLRRHLGRARGGRILDIGCGGGHGEALRYGAREVVGLDLSLHSLRCASALYPGTVQASAARMPFPDGHFDAVISSNFLGHVPFEEKDAVFGEMTRVLRRGGIMLHQLETSSNGAIFRFARRNPDFYQEQIVDLDGHVGLELPSEALERFRRAGLRVSWARPDFVWYFYPQGESLKRFDNPYARSNRALRLLVGLDRLLSDKPRARKLVDLAFGMANGALLRLTPLDRGIGLRVVLRKK